MVGNGKQIIDSFDCEAKVFIPYGNEFFFFGNEFLTGA